MAIADRERELIGIRTKAALTEKRKRDGEWRRGSVAFKEKLAVSKAVTAIKDHAAKNENNRRAAAIIDSLRKQGKNWLSIAKALNEAGFRSSRGKLFQAI
jgi:DNA invertase Pin-like site-specific DNA recombinase